MRKIIIIAALLAASSAHAKSYEFVDDGVLVSLNETQARRLQNAWVGINDLSPCPWGPLALWTFPTPAWTPPAPTPLAVSPLPTAYVIEPPGLIPNPPTTPAVPEASTWVMVLMGLASLMFTTWRATDEVTKQRAMSD